MKSHVTWFVVLSVICMTAPYVLRVPPRSRRHRLYVALTIAFLAWLLALMVPLRAL